MPSYLKHDVVLVQYPFSDLTGAKVRPAIVVNAPHISQDLLIVPLTSKIGSLLSGEFVLADWRLAGLNVESAVKRGIYTIQQRLVAKKLGKLTDVDAAELASSVINWLGL